MEIALRRREQEVWQVLDDLWALHGDVKNLTGDSIRERLVQLGKSKGSPNEIYKYRKTWVISRGISPGSYQARDESESDPISRAVHMVHEKLQEETNQQISELKTDYERQLLIKDEEIKEQKQSVSKMVVEFGELEREFKKEVAEKNELREQLTAEIEIRRAQERELALIKSEAQKTRLAHEELLTQLKEAHTHHVASLSLEKNQVQERADRQIQALLEDKKLLGQEFSEQLNQLKLEIHNKDIIAQNLSNRAIELSGEVEALQKIVTTLRQENAALLVRLEYKDRDMSLMTKDQHGREHEHKHLMHALRKAEITIGRLRAMTARRLCQ